MRYIPSPNIGFGSIEVPDCLYLLFEVSNVGRIENRDLWSELDIAFCIHLAVLRVNTLVARFLEKVILSKTKVGKQSTFYFTKTEYICFSML